MKQQTTLDCIKMNMRNLHAVKNRGQKSPLLATERTTLIN